MDRLGSEHFRFVPGRIKLRGLGHRVGNGIWFGVRQRLCIKWCCAVCDWRRRFRNLLV